MKGNLQGVGGVKERDGTPATARCCRMSQHRRLHARLLRLINMTGPQDDVVGRSHVPHASWFRLGEFKGGRERHPSLTREGNARRPPPESNRRTGDRSHVNRALMTLPATRTTSQATG